MTMTQDELHAAIMNLPANAPNLLGNTLTQAYNLGHRDARHAAAELALARASLPVQPPHFDVEAMLVACVPGGSSCDPQRVSDAIREYCASHPQPTEHSAELEAVQRDAMRYRHLKDCNSSSLMVMKVTGVREDDYLMLTGGHADEAIDAEIDAIAAAAQKGDK